ncbi:hypothetical protein IG631_03156 [Alternaria alternata]|nr:hypothetical protein IG631_03156 [Alternaria alternata]
MSRNEYEWAGSLHPKARRPCSANASPLKKNRGQSCPPIPPTTPVSNAVRDHSHPESERPSNIIGILESALEDSRFE